MKAGVIGAYPFICAHRRRYLPTMYNDVTEIHFLDIKYNF